MHTLIICGIIVMTTATLSLMGLAIDSVFRHGGEGFLLALGLAGGAIIPAWTALAMAGYGAGQIATIATWYVATLLVSLAIFGAVLLTRGMREGVMCLGIAVVLGAATYALAPGYIAAHQPPAGKGATTRAT